MHTPIQTLAHRYTRTHTCHLHTCILREEEREERRKGGRQRQVGVGGLWAPMFIILCFLSLDTAKPTTSSSCRHNSPPWNKGLKPRINRNPFLLKLLLQFSICNFRARKGWKVIWNRKEGGAWAQKMWWKPQALEKQAEADGLAQRSQGGTRNQGGSTVDSARSKHACNPSTDKQRWENQGFNTWATRDFVSKKIERKNQNRTQWGELCPITENPRENTYQPFDRGSRHTRSQSLKVFAVLGQHYSFFPSEENHFHVVEDGCLPWWISCSMYNDLAAPIHFFAGTAFY